MRLEKAERAIEQERATIKQLQQALQAAQQVMATSLLFPPCKPPCFYFPSSLVVTVRCPALSEGAWH